MKMKTKTQITKQTLSIFLCFVMLLTYVPITASAADAASYVDCSWDGSKVVQTTKEVTEYTVVTESTTTMSNGCPHTFSNGICTVCGATCDHSGNTNAPTDLGNGTHSFTCSACGATVTEEHTVTTGTCICGAAASLTNGSTVTYYETLEAAITAAQSADGSTVTLLANCVSSNNSWFTITSGRFTIDLNGKKLVPRGTANTSLFIEGGNIALFDDNEAQGGASGMVVVKNAALTIDGGIYESVVQVRENGTLIIDNGTIDRIEHTAGALTVKGGEITLLRVFKSSGKTLADVLPKDYYIYDKNGKIVDAGAIEPNLYDYRVEGFTVKKGAVITADMITVKELTYNGEKQVPNSANVTVTVGGVELQHSVDYTIRVLDDEHSYVGAGEWEFFIDMGVNPNYTGESITMVQTIKKATPVVTAPTANTLTYNGQAQALITAGSTTGGEIQYSLVEDGTYGISIPTSTDAGTYTVYYKVVGDDNYENVAAQSITVTITDETAPTGEILIKDNSWKQFWNDLTFGLFFKETQDVTITATDVGSGIKSIEYYLASGELELDEVRAITDWVGYNGTFKIAPNNKYVVYAKVTDNAGNTMYINSDSITLDNVAPTLEGIENGKTYYGALTVIKSDEQIYDIKAVTLDGEPMGFAEGTYGLIPADNAEHTVVVEDHVGNKTTYTVTVMKNYTVTYKADGVTVDTQTVGHGKDANAPTIPVKDGYVGKWDRNNENITSDTVISAVYTEIDNVVPDELKTDDKTELEDTKKQLEDMLDDNGYTDDDKKGIQEAIDGIDDALKVIENVEAVEDKINNLPETITKNDEAAIKAADDAYNALSDYEKSLVDEDAKKALDDAKAALAELGKPADPNSPATGDNSNMFLWIALLFISGGAAITLAVYDRKKRAAQK